MSPKATAADVAIAHRLLDALSVAPSPSLAARISSLERHLLEREAILSEIAEEADRMRSELEDVRAALRHETSLLEELEAEAARP